MLTNWLTLNRRTPSSFRFGVIDITETTRPDVSDPNDEIINYLANRLLLAHGDPEMIKGECQILLKDAETLDLDVIKKYVEEEVLPTRDRGLKLSTWIGNFGEILAAQFLIETEGFWFPIYKLRFREKRTWAMQLTDLCLIKVDGLSRPLVCYGEVKTRSSKKCDRKVGIEGHDSLVKDDALQKPEILRFVCNLLYSMGKYEEAELLSRLRLERLEYDRKHSLFLVHEQTTWDEEILGNLQAHALDPQLVSFSVNVVLIQQLRQIIDESYARAWQGVEVLFNE